MLRPQDKVMPDWPLNKPFQQTVPKAGAFTQVPYIWLMKPSQQCRVVSDLVIQDYPGLFKDVGAKYAPDSRAK